MEFVLSAKCSGVTTRRPDDRRSEWMQRTRDPVTIRGNRVDAAHGRSPVSRERQRAPANAKSDDVHLCRVDGGPRGRRDRAGGLAGQLAERDARAVRPGIAGTGAGVPGRPDRPDGRRGRLAGPAGVAVAIGRGESGLGAGPGRRDQGRVRPGRSGGGRDPPSGRRARPGGAEPGAGRDPRRTRATRVPRRDLRDGLGRQDVADQRPAGPRGRQDRGDHGDDPAGREPHLHPERRRGDGLPHGHAGAVRDRRRRRGPRAGSARAGRAGRPAGLRARSRPGPHRVRPACRPWCARGSGRSCC